MRRAAPRRSEKRAPIAYPIGVSQTDSFRGFVMKKDRAHQVSSRRMRWIAAGSSLIAVAVGILLSIVCDAPRCTSSPGELVPRSRDAGGNQESARASADVTSVQDSESVDANVAMRQRAAGVIGSMPMVFEENRGQWDVPAPLVGRGSGMLAGFEPHAIRLALFGKNDDGERGAVGLRLEFAEGIDAAPVGVDRLKSHRNYYHGNDPSKWQTDVALYARVSYPDLYPGVSLVVGSPTSGLEYDLLVASAQCLDAVRVDCDGVRSMSIAPTGELELETEIGVLRQSIPKAWFVAKDGAEHPADCRFRRMGPTSYGFSVANPEKDCALVVDPGLAWSTYLGGLNEDTVYGIDFVNNLVTVVGSTNGGGFPVTTGAFQTTPGGFEDAFVTKFDPTSTGVGQLIWSTYLGGSNYGFSTLAEHANAVSLDAAGNVALCGITGSPNFPVSTSAFQSAPIYMLPGQQNAFVTKLSTLGAMLYSTYYGGNAGIPFPFVGLPTHANAVIVNPAGIITVAGGTSCTDLTLVNPNELPSMAASNDADAWVAAFNPALSGAASLVYSTYVTGNSYEDIFGLDVRGGRIHVGGSTLSSDLLVGGPNGALQPTPPSATGGAGPLDGFIRVLDPSLTGAAQLIYSTYLGSAAIDEVLGLVVDSRGAIHCCGYTLAAGGSVTGPGYFPVSTVSNPTNPFNGGEADYFQAGAEMAFLVKLNYNTTGQQLLFGTLFDQPNGLTSTAMAIARVADRQDIIVGKTIGNNLPVTTGAVQSVFGGSTDAFLARLDWTSSPATVTYCTYLGDTAVDVATCVVIDGLNAYVGGLTFSSNFPVTVGAFQGGNAGGRDGFALKLSLPDAPLR